jgi:hypothetical protein
MDTDSESNAIEGDRKKEKKKRTTKGFTLYIYAQRIWICMCVHHVYIETNLYVYVYRMLTFSTL